jgi:hypothetical protein
MTNAQLADTITYVFFTALLVAIAGIYALVQWIRRRL